MKPDSAVLKPRLMEIRSRVSPIQGWLSPEAGTILYELVRFEALVPTVVELGAWRGLSTAWLGFGVHDRGEGVVYSIDHWQGSPAEPIHQQMLQGYAEDQLFQEWYGNMRSLGLADLVSPIKCDTVTASRNWPLDREIGLLFIDASHEYLDVRRDFEFWSPLVSPGGYIVFDDVPIWYGPTRLVQELPRWCKEVRAETNIWVGQKTKELT